MMNNIENSGYKVFLELLRRDSTNKEYVSVESMPFSDHHKMGISSEGYPIFFVKCDNLTKAININLELISVLFSQECNIKENENNKIEIYTIFVLKTYNIDLQQYFIDVFSIILQQIETIPSEKDLYIEVKKVIDLFSSINKPPLKSIQGLWAELLVIEKSKNPDYLINSWHISPTDKFDFNDGKDKIEVKSTSKSTRIHRFSIDQLNNNSGSNLLIASAFIIETGSGTSIINLRDSIVSRIRSIEVQLRLNEIIYKTIGNDYEKLGELYFDYQLASDSLSYYNAFDVPRILVENIPPQVSNIVFDSNITNIQTAFEKEGHSFEQSQLFKSLNI